MKPKGAATALRGALLCGATLLGGCSSLDDGTSRFFYGIAGFGERYGAPWGGMRAGSPAESTTAQRVRGTAEPPTPLLPEEGNVWPAQEPPRTTLANPDAALRGIPTYRPDTTGRPAGLPNRQEPPLPGPDPAQTAPPPGSISRGAPIRARGSSSPPPDALTPAPEQRFPAVPPTPLPVAPADGRPAASSPLQTPGGVLVPGATSGNTGVYTTPGGGSGLIRRDGGTATVTEPGGRIQVVPNR